MTKINPKEIQEMGVKVCLKYSDLLNEDDSCHKCPLNNSACIANGGEFLIETDNKSFVDVIGEIQTMVNIIIREAADDKRRNLPSVTPQEPFINKPCVSSGVCEHDKTEVLDKIRAEIAEYGSIWVEYKITGNSNRDIEKLVGDVLIQAKEQVLDVIDKYKAESEG